MKRTLIVILNCIIFFSLKAQDTNYVNLVEKAFKELESNNCESCLRTYETAFKISQHRILSCLRASLCAFECKNDSAFRYHLDFALKKDAGVVEQILEDKNYHEFDKYRNTAFFTTANDAIKEANKREVDSKDYDAALREELKLIEKDDQELRLLLEDETIPQEKKNGIWPQITILDSLNLIKIGRILDKYGYPGKSKVGARYSGTAFLVLQHSNLAAMKKYYKIIEQAANKGEFPKSYFALFVDRVRMLSGEKQLYGTQIRSENHGPNYMYAIEDEINVNKRRAEMGLPPLEEYAKYFKIDYKLPTTKN